MQKLIEGIHDWTGPAFAHEPEQGQFLPVESIAGTQTPPTPEMPAI